MGMEEERDVALVVAAEEGDVWGVVGGDGGGFGMDVAGAVGQVGCGGAGDGVPGALGVVGVGDEDGGDVGEGIGSGGEASGEEQGAVVGDAEVGVELEGDGA